LATSASSLLLNNSGTNTTTGFGQGIDVNSFVQLALNADQARITNLQNQQTGIDSQRSTLAQINSYLTTLQSASDALKDPLGALGSSVATSSNEAAVTATSESNATAGTYTISVTSLATTSSYYTATVATGNTALRTGDTISISAGGVQAASVTTDSTNNTLAQVAAAINTQTSAVHASVVNDANGARLVVVSAVSGAPGNLAASGGLFLPNGNPIAFTQAVAGLNAALTVDNVPITSTSNQVPNVISGVTLNLVAPTGSTPATLTVGPDTSTITAAINQFVSAYNTAITAINGQFQVNSDGTAGVLEADGSLREAQQTLLGAIAYSTGGNGGQINLGSLGISVNNDGTLTVDSAALSSAVSSHISYAQAFLQTASTGFAVNLSDVLRNLLDPSSGALGLDSSGLTQSSQSLSQQITDQQAALAVRQQNLVAVYAQVNTTLQLLPLLQAQLTQQLGTA
jgi:flagellar hook-associated protein 2